MSLTVSRIIARVNESHPDVWPSPQIATTVAFICGFIVLCLGILRLGWLVEFIPAPAVSGFMTGSAINIVAGQVPGLLGETGFEYVIILRYSATELTPSTAPVRLPTRSSSTASSSFRSRGLMLHSVSPVSSAYT